MVDFLSNVPSNSFLAKTGSMEGFDIEGQLVKADPMDPQPLIDLLKRFNEEIDRIADQAAKIDVIDDESCKKAVEMTNQAKNMASVIKKETKTLKRPYLDVTQPLDAFSKTIDDRLGLIQAGLNKKIGPFLQKKEELRRVEKQVAEKEAAEIQKKLDEESNALGETAPIVVASAPKEIKVQTASGTADLKSKWTFKIVDPKRLPAAAFEDRKNQIIAALKPWVNNQVKAGARKIEGVSIFQEQTVSTRAKAGRFKF